MAVILAGPESVQAWQGVPSCAYDEVYPGSDLLESSFIAGDAMCRSVEPRTQVILTPEVAREALQAAESDPPGHEALRLEIVAEVHPDLADWLAVRRGEDFLEAGDPQAAEEAFLEAVSSVDSDVRVHGRTGRVIALLQRDHRDAEREVRLLRMRYPELPGLPRVLLEVGAYNARRGDTSDATSIYRGILVNTPGRPAAVVAQERLEALRAGGTRVRELTPGEVVERAERLFSRGPLTQAREALAALEESPPVHPTLRAKAFALMAKLARHEGRFNDATRYFRLSARAGAYGDAEDIERRVSRSQDVAEAANSDAEAARGRLGQMQGRRPLSRIATPRLLRMTRVAARGGLIPELNAIVERLITRNVLSTHRLGVVQHAIGIADDDVLLRLLGDAGSGRGSRAVRARYYEARLLQRAQRHAEAEQAFLDVVERDSSELTWYALWSENELRNVRRDMAGSCGPNADCTTSETEGSTAELQEGRATPPDTQPPAPVIDLDAFANRLAPLADAYGEAFPWLPRAVAFLRIGEKDEASRQLYETYLAWRAANGRAILRCGFESVAMGKNRRRVAVSFALRQSRRALDSDSRAELAAVAEGIHSYGAAVGFKGWSAVGARPRAYADLVEAAAGRYGLDPNLLFAVMRVESVYQEHIVSYAGAIGLAQIMPRTGTLIAHELGREDFQTSDLLDPETNLEFAAWYLRSLIDRWDGHVALAIASYNGGPHNVRRWLRDYGSGLTLDAFLEHIPFEQTHRYVRRVLGHYRAYRAQVGLSMIALDDSLPGPSVDPIGF
ncbi:MAG: soluble lytic murein transglycosylase [Polyangiales bacterium]|jgi:soluble lytic murein transglycosylase